MKNRMFMVAVILSAVLCWPTGWSIENPGIGNPVGPSTVPPSTFQNGLVNSPAPIDTSGNLLITGNVRRGRHFRGDVPYRSPTSFSSSLGSSSLNSFLRDTAGSEDISTYSNKYGTQPYYSPTGTVTTMTPGRSEIFRPTNTRISTRSTGTDISGLEFQPKEQTLFSQGAPSADSSLQGLRTQYGPLAQSRMMLESKFPSDMSLKSRDTVRLEPAQIGIRRQSQTSAFELFKEQVQDIRDRTQSTGWPSPESTTVPDHGSRESLLENNSSFQYMNREMNTENLRPKFEKQTPPQNRAGDRKQTTYAHQGTSALEQFTPSIDSTSQKNLFLQKGTNSYATSREFQTGQGQNATGTLGTLETGIRDTSGLTGIGQDREQSDVLERIRQQLDDLTKVLDATAQSRDTYKNVNAEMAVKREEAPLGHQRYVPDSRQVIPRERINSSGILNSYKPQGTEISFDGKYLAATEGGLNRADDGRQTGLEFTGIPNYDNSQKRSSPLKKLDKLSQADISAEAKRIMGPHGSHESLSVSKFNQHIHEADEHLKAGRYYRAAGCFSLASVYQSDNPLALAGRGHALFAAGEYVSSALFLSRALAVSPEYLLVKVDLVAMLGDENKLAGRIADIEQWLARSGSSQLQFLLGYVYYRTGQLFKAKQAIDAAYGKTPESPAVQAMKIAIDNIKQ